MGRRLRGAEAPHYHRVRIQLLCNRSKKIGRCAVVPEQRLG